jgi:acetyl-CoA acetyltransferase
VASKSSRWKLSDKAIISGVGTAGYFRSTEESEASLALQAVIGAARDAALDPKDIDGVITYQYNNDSVRPQEIAQSLGVHRLRLWLENWLGGTVGASLLAIAAMAVDAGMADNVVVFRSAKHRSGRVRIGGSGQAADTGGLEQFLVPQGWANFFTGMAADAVRYMYDFGMTEAHLGKVALNAYGNAALNDRAVGKNWGPKTLEEYYQAPFLAYPFRRWDFASEVDGACAFIVQSADRAADLPKKPVFISSAAQSSTPDPMHTGRFAHYDVSKINATRGAAAYFRDELFSGAGLSPSDIDLALLYDQDSFHVIRQLEDLGFCAKGEGGSFVDSGAIGLTGTLPVNTSGGLLAEGYLHGTNLVIEAVEQLRGEAGTRQVPGAKTAIVSYGPGPLGGGLILTAR